MPYPESTSPDALRRSLNELRTRATDAEQETASLALRVAELEAATTSGLTDGTPRWIKVDVDYTDFPDAATTSQHLLIQLPAGTACTHQWIEPGDAFTSTNIPGGGVWRMSIVKDGTIIDSAGGTAKDVDVTTPDAMAQQYAAEHIVSDTATANDWYVQIDSGGVDNASKLTAGTATVHLLVSVPGSTANDLPHS